MLEVSGDPKCGRRALADSREQRSHSSQQQPRLKPARHGTVATPPGPDSLDEGAVGGGHDRTGQDIGVPVQILAGRVRWAMAK